MTNDSPEAIVVGAGPNGFAAGIFLASKGLSVKILEEKDQIGGGCRSEELTLPGFIHDVCSSIHPLAIGSPYFRILPLDGIEWIQPNAPLAHPFDDGTCALLERSIDKTSQSLEDDGPAYKNLMNPIVKSWPQLENAILGPISIPSHPITTLKFGLKGIQSAKSLIKRHFKGKKGRGLFAGLAAHSILPLDRPITAAVGLVLGTLGHVYGWPMPKGGSQKITDALAKYFISLGGQIETGRSIASIDDLPSIPVLFDLTPKQILQISGDHFTKCYRKQLQKYRYGPGVFKIDWALNDPIPWKSKDCLLAGTIHLGGTFEEIAASEQAIWKGQHSEKPYVLLAQHTLFDPTRAPKGKHTAWAYCHVPHGSEKDMTNEIENQIERFAPGFRDCILKRGTKNTSQMTAFNSNYIGGDIIGGVQDIWQLLTRPTKKLVPYATSNPRLFICSSSTPPGGGVHGMCGYHAAQVVYQRTHFSTQSATR